MRQKRLRWFRHVVKREEEVEIECVGVENRKTKRGRPVKLWNDVIEDTRKRGFVQQDAGIGRVRGGELLMEWPTIVSRKHLPG